MDRTKLAFSIDMHDRDGDVYESGIYLHIDDTTIIRVGNDLVEFDAFVAHIQGMRAEIVENLTT